MDDLTLVRRAQRGDTEAFGMLLHRYGNSVANYLNRFMPDRDDIDDLFQEVFLKAFLNLARFDAARGKFHTWLYRIATNTSLDEIRRRQREDLRKETAANEWLTDSHQNRIPDHEADSSSHLHPVLQSLPDTERQVILLAFYHDLRYREISEILEIPLGTVKTRVRNALSRLRENLVHSEAGDSR